MTATEKWEKLIDGIWQESFLQIVASLVYRRATVIRNLKDAGIKPRRVGGKVVPPKSGGRWIIRNANRRYWWDGVYWTQKRADAFRFSLADVHRMIAWLKGDDSTGVAIEKF